ncbi:hypothetical protein K7432_009145 [Basidiobolus ranarum]|uniref:PhnB-like domain-containing protein n=1 Tax=Basidiobolus ranarum TaxID=34480 RepID=A0ABR2WQV1_9FUNG
MSLSKITPCLWFDKESEEAAKFYTSIFPNSSMGTISRYSEIGKEHHGQEPGSVMIAAFTICGQTFTALNGGTNFKITEAISFQVDCEDQAEVDRYWEKLVEGGGSHSACGWLKDRFGVSWQIIPKQFTEYMKDSQKAERVFKAMLGMTKFIIADLDKAAKGE